MNAARLQRAKECFRRACRLDVSVRKPGNVSLASPGHGMTAAQFVESGDAAAEALFVHGATVGARIEAAVRSSWAAAGCNTNLGIVLLAAPLAAAAERVPAGAPPGAWPHAVDEVIGGLDREDAAGAYRAIALAHPAGLGRVEREDVHAAPSVTLREAMAIAAPRDSIARQYAEGFRDLFGLADEGLGNGFSLMAMDDALVPDAATVTSVQQLYLACLARWPDSHIVRKHGEAVAQNVLRAAQGLQGVAGHEREAALAQWDEALKRLGVNPGTSADLTVATLLLAGLLAA